MKNKNIIIGVLALISVLLFGFIIYDKVLLDDKTDVVDKDNLDDENVENNNYNNNDYKENNISEDNIGNIEVKVVDVNKNTEKITGNYKDYTEDCTDMCTISSSCNKCTINYKFEFNNSYNSNVGVNDTYAIVMQPEFGKRLFILNDGKLYYNIANCNDGYCHYKKYDFYEESDNNNYKKLYLFNELKNIKRIKGYNHGSGIDYSLLLITNDGDVYNLHYDGKFTLSKDVKLSKYYIDDIIEYQDGFQFNNYKVILKDGTILTKSYDIEYDGE